MKKHIYPAAALITLLAACEPQQMETREMGPGPANARIETKATDPYNPVFTAKADRGYIFH